MARARRGVRRRGRDDVHLDFAYITLVRLGCQGLVSASLVAAATTSASTSRAYTKHSGSLLFPFHFKRYIKGCLSPPTLNPKIAGEALISRARFSFRRRCREDVRLDFAYTKLVRL